MKKIFYKGKDITENIEILSAIICDNAGGRADTCSMILSDRNKIWREYPPIKGDTIELIYEDFKSGIMYIDEFYLHRGVIKIDAIATPLSAKNTQKRSWTNISFKQLANELTNQIGLNISFYNVNDHTYVLIEQKNISNLALLNDLCILEGLRLKIINNNAVIYDEKYFENNETVINLCETDFVGDYSFLCKNSKMYSSIMLEYGQYKYNAISKNVLNAASLIIDDIKVYSDSEAERFSNNLLKYYNKNEYTGEFTIKLKCIAAGSNVNINDLGAFNGKNFIEKVTHNLIKNTSTLKVRKVLGGI